MQAIIQNIIRNSRLQINSQFNTHNTKTAVGHINDFESKTRQTNWHQVINSMDEIARTLTLSTVVLVVERLVHATLKHYLNKKIHEISININYIHLKIICTMIYIYKLTSPAVHFAAKCPINLVLRSNAGEHCKAWWPNQSDNP